MSEQENHKRIIAFPHNINHSHSLPPDQPCSTTTKKSHSSQRVLLPTSTLLKPSFATSNLPRPSLSKTAIPKPTLPLPSALHKPKLPTSLETPQTPEPSQPCPCSHSNESIRPLFKKIETFSSTLHEMLG